MAIWQFTFHLVPRETVERHHGTTALILEAFTPTDPENWVEGKEHINYWEGRSPLSYATEMERLLPPRKSWSEEALMFGDENGDDLDLWDNDIRVRLHAGHFRQDLARSVVNFAANNDLMLVMGQTGRLIPPIYDKLIKELSQSRAAKFVSAPVETLRMIGREAE